MNQIQCNRLDRCFNLYQNEFEKKAIDVLRSGYYILGNEEKEFEKEFAQFIGYKYCAGVGNGLDALQIAFHVLGIGTGDEVIVPGNTFIASVMGITRNGATPVFVDPNESYNIDPSLIEEKITERTKAILVVHLYGQAAEMDRIMEIAQKYKLKIVEDCAQSHGATYHGKMTGSFGDISCFSFYPTKNLGAFGDGGAVVSNSQEYDKKVRCYRNYGSEKKYNYKEIGINSRLDEMQAGLLRVKLSHIQELINERRYIANRYTKEIWNENLILPKADNSETVWHQYVVRTKHRDEFLNYMQNAGIQTLIHYPVPPHKSEAYAMYNSICLPRTEQYANEVLSLPIYNGMLEEEIDYVIESVNKFIHLSL